MGAADRADAAADWVADRAVAAADSAADPVVAVANPVVAAVNPVAAVGDSAGGRRGGSGESGTRTAVEAGVVAVHPGWAARPAWADDPLPTGRRLMALVSSS